MAEKMDKGRLMTILLEQRSDAVDFRDSSISAEQSRAWRYYNGQNYGDEEDGRSTVVTREVAEAVDWMMPDLMRIFASGDKVVEFDPTGEGDEEVAEQATAYVNHIFWNDNPGYQITYSWFKDALIQKNGVVKVHWDDTPTVERQERRGLSTPQVQLLELDDNVEILERDARILDSQEQVQIFSDQQAAVLYQDGQVWDLVVSVTTDDGRIRIVNVPPENFLAARHANDLDDGYQAHREEKSLYALIDEGLATEEEARALPQGDRDGEEAKRERHEHDRQPVESLDPLARKVWVYEEYIEVDFDGDGHAELRQIISVDSTILSNEEVDDTPFASLTPDIQPHRYYGKSVADMVVDLQRINSVLTRQVLDNVYQVNEPRMMVNVHAFTPDTLDDLLTREIGGIIRLDRPPADAIREETVSFVGQAGLAMLDHFSTQAERRTGVTRLNQGLDADTLTETATGTLKLMAAAQGRKELIARTFAETGVSTLFRKIYRLVIRNQDADRIIRLNDEWVPIDPRDWNSQMDVTVRVGLGTDDREQAPQKLLQILSLQRELVLAGQLPDAEEMVFNTLDDLVTALGVGNTTRYFPNPANQPPQEPQPDPAALEAQAEQEAQMLELQIEAQTEIEKANIKARADIIQTQMKLQAEQGLTIREQDIQESLKVFELNVQGAQFLVGLRENPPNIDPNIRSGAR